MGPAASGGLLRATGGGAEESAVPFTSCFTWWACLSGFLQAPPPSLSSSGSPRSSSSLNMSFLSSRLSSGSA